MNRAYKLLALAAIAFGVGCAPSGSEVDLESEAQAVREESAAFFAAELNRDLEGFLSYLAPDAVIQVGDVPTMDVGGLRTYTDAFFKLPYTDITYTEPRNIVVAESGDMAYDFGAWTVILEGEDRSSDLFGKSTIIWRKINGEWKAVVMSFSLDAPAVASAN